MSRKKVPMMSAKPVVAIVEDDESLRFALSGLMRSLGYVSHEFSSAEAFISSDAPFTSNCLVTDFQLPGLNGVELAAKLKGRLPVIMITARTEQALDTLANENGVLCLLRKPFEAEDLAECIRRALDSLPCEEQKDIRGNSN